MAPWEGSATNWGAGRIQFPLCRHGGRAKKLEDASQKHLSESLYLAMRKNEIWPFVAMWVELEGITLSEISQAEKDRYHMFSLICGS